MKKIPYEMTVEREREPMFLITQQAHDFITKEPARSGKRAEIAESCSKCHKAELTAQPSRIKKKKFHHSTHLPKKASAKDCETCHPSIKDTTGPGDIGSAMFPLYDAKVCNECHKGVKVETVEAKKSRVSVPFFRHADHVGKELDGQTVSCIDCHASEIAAGKNAVGVLETARSCKSCHNHGKYAAITAKVSDPYVENCLRCHKLGVPPNGGELPPQERQFVAGILDQQYHPDPSTRPCETCHEASINGPLQLRRENQTPLLFGSGFYVGSDGEGFHKANEAPGGVDVNRSEVCMCCHWAQQTESRERYKWPPSISPGAKLTELRNAALRRPTLYRNYPGLDCCRQAR
jgi:hypothetical protein